MSKKPGKQRKSRFAASMHERKKLLRAGLSKELRDKLKTSMRTALINKGDTVKILAGKHKGKTGKVLDVDYNYLKIFVEGVLQRDAKGTEKPFPFDVSNLQITDGDFKGDREAILKRG